MDKYNCYFQFVIIYLFLLINIICRDNLLNIWKTTLLSITNLDKFHEILGLLLDKDNEIKYITFKKNEEYSIYDFKDNAIYNLTNFSIINKELIINNISFLCGQSKYIYYKIPNDTLKSIQISNNDFIDYICFENKSDLIVFNPGNEGISILNINDQNIKKNKYNMDYLFYYFIVNDNESYYILVKDNYNYIIINLSYSGNNNFNIEDQFRLPQNFILFNKIKVSYYNELLFIFTYEENTSSFITYKIDLKLKNIIINDILTSNGLFLGTKFVNIFFIPKTQFIYYSLKKENNNYLGLFDIESNILIFNIQIESNVLFYTPYTEDEIIYSISYINNSILYEICPFNEINNNSKKCEFNLEKKFEISPENGNKKINECSNSYNLFKNYCIDKCPIGTEEKNNICQNKCENNMKLNLIKNECVIECEDDELLINNFCISYIKNNVFLSQNSLFSIENCEDAFHKPYNEKNKCLSKCKLGSYYNENEKKCINCKELGQYLNEELNECIDECPNDIYDENNICFNCIDRGLFTYKNVSNQNKIECLISCSDNYLQLNSLKNECFKCPKGYYYDTNPLIEIDKKCVEICSDFYYIKNGICEKCSDYLFGKTECINYNNDIKYCNIGSEINKNDKTCKKCSNEGEKYINGSCYSECDDYTIQDEKNICLNCINNETHQYFYNSNCIDTCPIESKQTGYICNDCSKLDLIYFSGQCVKNCPYYTNFVDNKCKLCEEIEKDKPFYSNYSNEKKFNCKSECNDNEEEIYEVYRKECILCDKIYNGKCIDKCPIHTKDINNKCQECPGKQFLYKDNCINNCIEGTRIIGKYCEKCNKIYYNNNCDKSEDKDNTYVLYEYEGVQILKTCYCNQKFKGGICKKEDNIYRLDYKCQCNNNFKGNNCHINYNKNKSEFSIDVYNYYPPIKQKGIMFISNYTGNEIIESFVWNSLNTFCFELNNQTNQNCEINGKNDEVYILDKEFFQQIPCNYSISCEITLKNGQKLKDTIYINPSVEIIDDTPRIRFFFQNDEEEEEEEEEEENYNLNSINLINKFINLKFNNNEYNYDENNNDDDKSITLSNNINYCPMQTEINMTIEIEYSNSSENFLYQLYYSMEPISNNLHDSNSLFEFSKKFFRVDAPKKFYFPGKNLYLKIISKNGYSNFDSYINKIESQSHCNTLNDIKNDDSIFIKTGKLLSLFDYNENEDYNLNLTKNDLVYIEDYILTNFKNSLQKKTLSESIYEVNDKFDDYYLPGEELFILNANSYQLILRYMIKYLFNNQNELFKDGLKILSKSLEILSNYKLDSQNKMYIYMLDTYNELFNIVLDNHILDNNIFYNIYSDIQKLTGIICKAMLNGEIYHINKDNELFNIRIYRFGRSQKTIYFNSSNIFIRLDSCDGDSLIDMCIEKNSLDNILNEINQFENAKKINVGLSLINYNFSEKYIGRFLNETMMNLFKNKTIEMISKNISHINIHLNESFNVYQVKNNYFYTISFGKIKKIKNKNNTVCVPIEYLGKNDKNNFCKTYFSTKDDRILCECNTFSQIAVIENEYYANFYKELQFNDTNKMQLSILIISCTVCTIAFFSIILLFFDINDERKIEKINQLTEEEKIQYYYSKVSYLNKSNILSFSWELFHIYFPFSNIFNVYSSKIARHLRFIVEIIKIIITLIISLYFSFYGKHFTELNNVINERNFYHKMTKKNFEPDRKNQIFILFKTLFFYFLVSSLFDFICNKFGYDKINKNKFKPIKNIISRFIYYKVKPSTLFNDEKGKKVRTRMIALSKIYGNLLSNAKNNNKSEIVNEKSLDKSSIDNSSIQISFISNDNIENNDTKTNKKRKKYKDIFQRYMEILKHKKESKNNHDDNEKNILKIVQDTEENNINYSSLIINILSNIIFIVITSYLLIKMKKMIDKVYEEFENYLIYSWLIPSIISIIIYNFVINFIVCIVISLIFFKSFYSTSSKIKKLIYKYKHIYKIMVLISNNKDDIEPQIEILQVKNNTLNNQ